jgi:hypothetical protein
MSVIRAGLRPAFALFVIAHAAAHALLPLQEFLSPEHLANDPGPLILLGVVAIGFIVAGAGLLGVWPFKTLIRPALVLASAYSLIAIWRMGHGGFWWGAPADLVLLAIGVTGFLPRAVARSGAAPHQRAAGTPAAHRTA